MPWRGSLNNRIYPCCLRRSQIQDRGVHRMESWSPYSSDLQTAAYVLCPHKLFFLHVFFSYCLVLMFLLLIRVPVRDPNRAILNSLSFHVYFLELLRIKDPCITRRGLHPWVAHGVASHSSYFCSLLLRLVWSGVCTCIKTNFSTELVYL